MVSFEAFALPAPSSGERYERPAFVVASIGFRASAVVRRGTCSSVDYVASDRAQLEAVDPGKMKRAGSGRNGWKTGESERSGSGVSARRLRGVAV